MGRKGKQGSLWLILLLIMSLTLQSTVGMAAGIQTEEPLQETALESSADAEEAEPEQITHQSLQTDEIISLSSVPAAPSGVQVSSASMKGLELRWEAVSGATAYYVYRADDSGQSWSCIATVWTNQYSDMSALPGKNYRYQVQSIAYDGSQWIGGGFSSAVEGSYQIGVPAGLRAASDGTAGVQLSWSYGGQADAFGILRAQSPEGPYEWISSVGGTAYSDTQVSVGGTYYYQVYAAVMINGAWSNGTKSEPVSVTVPDPNALQVPQNVKVENKDDRGLTISWDASRNASGYIVYRVDEETGALTWLNSLSGTSYCDSDVKLGDTCTYQVQSIRYVNQAWEYGPSSAAAEGRFLPSAPTNLRVVPGAGTNAVKITWQPTGNASLFGVARSESADGTYEWIGAAASASFTDAGLEAGKTYYYRVYASVNENGVYYNGDYSAAASGHVQEAPSTVEVLSESFSSVRVRWSAAAGATGYIVYRLSGDGTTWISLGSTNQTEFVDRNLDINSAYTYKVQSINFVDGQWGYGAYSGTAQGKPGVGIPSQLSARQDSKSYYGIALSWAALSEVDGYGIMRAVHGTDQYQWIGYTQSTSYLDASGNSDTQYDYKIYATVNRNGVYYNGAYSSAVTCMTRTYGGPPVVSNLRATYVSGQGYYVTCDIASAYPITQVTFPSWTTSGGQDDIVWKYGTVNGNEASCWIYASEHSYQIGQYETCAYAYDTIGQYSGTWCGVNVPVYSNGSGTGWYDTNGTSGERFYLLNGTAVTGWKYIGGLKYYFYPNGVLCQDLDNLIGVQSRYEIKVNKEANCVTIYASDGANGYIIPVKSMLCSTGDDTPLGTFYTPQKYRWKAMYNGTYAQFATRLTAGEGFLFHSITYEVNGDNRTLITEGYNGLGVTRSAGCIRLLCINAYWIYSRCVLGTKVTVYNSSTPGPYYRPVLVPIPADQRYDPTDPFL